MTLCFAFSPSAREGERGLVRDTAGVQTLSPRSRWPTPVYGLQGIS